MGAWGGYANGQIPSSAMKEVSPGKFMRPDAADQFIAAVADLAARGIKFGAQETYRPLGVPSDQNVRNENQTSTGGFNQWFAWGVYKRGGSLAATPGYSNHGWGLAADTTPGRENGTVAAVLRAHGFNYGVSSETWHCDWVGVAVPNETAQVQALLNNYGYGLVVDGISGPKTVAAIKDFQSKHGLKVDGIAGPFTLAALRGGATSIPDATGAQKAAWSALQGYLKQYWGYQAAIDGIAGKGTWTATQKWLGAQWGYKGAADGVPGPNTYAAMQRAGCSLR